MLELYHLYLTNLCIYLNLKNNYCTPLDLKNRSGHVPSYRRNVCHYMISVTIFCSFNFWFVKIVLFFKISIVLLYYSVVLVILFLVSVPIKYLQTAFWFYFMYTQSHELFFIFKLKIALSANYKKYPSWKFGY